MNDFKPKKLQEASHYLEDKLNLFKKGGAAPHTDNVYKLEDRKSSMFKRLVSSIFHK